MKLTQKYLEVRPEQVRGAFASLSMLSHIGKPAYDDQNSDTQNQQYEPTLKSKSE